MPRRALIPGDVVAAVEVRKRRRLAGQLKEQPRQTHMAERLEQQLAIEQGVLLPHRKYVVLARFQLPSEEGHMPAKTAPWKLLIGLPGHVMSSSMWGSRPCVKPGAVRLWTNPKERRIRSAARASEKPAPSRLRVV